MTTPAQALAAFRRCLKAGDYAGAVRLAGERTLLEALAPRPPEAEVAYRESVAAWRAEHEATLRRQQEQTLAELVALLAGAAEDAWLAQDERPGLRAVAPGNLDPALAVLNRDRLEKALREDRAARSASWPVSREEAA